MFNTGAPFDWFYYRILRPLIVDLGAAFARLLANVLLVFSGGKEIYVFQDGAYRLVAGSTGKDKSEGFDALVRLSKENATRRFPSSTRKKWSTSGVLRLRPGSTRTMADRVGLVINVGDAVLERPSQSIINLHRGYRRTIDLIIAASAASSSRDARVVRNPA